MYQTKKSKKKSRKNADKSGGEEKDSEIDSGKDDKKVEEKKDEKKVNILTFCLGRYLSIHQISIMILNDVSVITSHTLK